jgi:hypothetical protein
MAASGHTARDAADDYANHPGEEGETMTIPIVQDRSLDGALYRGRT